MAYELTSLVHDKNEADKATQTSKSLFGGMADAENMPKTVLTNTDLQNGEIGLLDIMVIAKLAQSKGEARRLVGQGGISIDGQKVEDFAMMISETELKNSIVIKKGKKIFHKVSL